jgi:membrane-associated phospholipid phosphatase
MRDEELPDGSALDRLNNRTLAAITATALGLVLAGTVLFDVAVPDRGLGFFEQLSLDIGVVLGIWGLITQLGDPWFLILLATFVYLLGTERSLAEEPREGAFVLAVTFAAFSLIDLLKHAYAAPRPPGAETVTVPTWLPPALAGAFQSITTGSGYAFPSGHAIGSTAVFAALASQLKVGTPASRWAVAATAIALVVVSRLVIGVHFAVDVVVGVVAGGSLFAVATLIGERRPLRVFGLGVVLGVLALVVSSSSQPEAIWKVGQWLGASLGGGIAWYLVRPSDTLDVRETALAGLPIAVLWVGVYLASPPLIVTVLGTAALAGLIISAPALVERVSRHEEI